MSAVTFDNLVTDLRADYVGQPRDGRGQFAATIGLLRSPTTEPTTEAPKPASGKNAIAKKVLGTAASIGIGVGAGLVAATLYEQLKPVEQVGSGDAAAPRENTTPTPEASKEAPKAAESGARKSQDERLKDILDQLTKEPPDSRAETPESQKLKDTLKEYQKTKAKPYRRPRPTTDAFQSVIDELKADWIESAHPRDKSGKFATKGSGRGGGSLLLSAAAPDPETTSQPGAGDKASQVPKDGLDELNIRNLKKLARENSVSGYSNMTKVELVQGIRAVKANPKQQERIKETILRKQMARKVIGNTPAAKFARDWQKMNKLVKAAGVSPGVGALALGSFLAVTAYKEWEKQRTEYQTHIGDSATDAATRSRTIPTEDFSDKSNLVFSVGGYKGMGSTGQEIIDEFTRDGNADAEWFKENANFVAVENNEYDVNPIMPKRLPGGMINPAYLGESLIRQGGNLIKQRSRKRNEQAVDLAAQIYAQMNARGGESGEKRVNKDLPITIIAHGAGGATVDEAMAILRSGKMHLGQSSKGTEFLDQIQVIKLGSTSIGMVDPPTRDKNPLSLRTFTSSNDPFSMLPKTNETWKQDVPGGDIKDYMRSPSIRDELLNTMGYDSSTFQSKKTAADVRKRAAERAKNFQDIKDKAAAARTAPTPTPPPSTPPAAPSSPKPQQQSPTPEGSRSSVGTTAAKSSPKKSSAKKTKAQVQAEAKASQPKKAGYTWIPKPGYAGKDGGPEGGYFRKATPKKKTDSAFDLVISHLLEV
jgi:hypothetical protein